MRPSWSVLCHSNIIFVILWWWSDVWDEKEKAQAYAFMDSRDNLTHHIGIVWEKLAFDHTVTYAQRWKSKLAEMMAWVIKPLTFRWEARLWTKVRHSNHSTIEDTTPTMRQPRVKHEAIICQPWEPIKRESPSHVMTIWPTMEQPSGDNHKASMKKPCDSYGTNHETTMTNTTMSQEAIMSIHKTSWGNQSCSNHEATLK